MSKNDPMRYEIAEMSFKCTHCRAPVGCWCTTPSGVVAKHLHSARRNALQSVISLSGYEEWGEQAVTFKAALRKIIWECEQVGLEGDGESLQAYLIDRIVEVTKELSLR